MGNFSLCILAKKNKNISTLNLSNLLQLTIFSKLSEYSVSVHSVLQNIAFKKILAYLKD